MEPLISAPRPAAKRRHLRQGRKTPIPDLWPCHPRKWLSRSRFRTAQWRGTEKRACRRRSTGTPGRQRRSLSPQWRSFTDHGWPYQNPDAQSGDFALKTNQLASRGQPAKWIRFRQITGSAARRVRLLPNIVADSKADGLDAYPANFGQIAANSNRRGLLEGRKFRYVWVAYPARV